MIVPSTPSDMPNLPAMKYDIKEDGTMPLAEG